jgi:type IV fimbrial biogenesis protein FimT
MIRGRIVGNSKGFSLIEVIVTIAVIGIIAAIAVPNMIGWRGERQLQGSARNFAADVQLARLKSIRESENVVVEVDDVADSYQMYLDANKNQTFDVGEDVIRNVGCPVGVSINSVTIPGNLTSLDPRGRSSTTGDVVFQNIAGTMKTISINILGSVSITE